MANASFAEILEASTERCRQMEAPLADRLQAFADTVRSLNGAFAEVVDRMPWFLLPDQDGALVSLGDLVSRSPVVISFHRGHWCPYCRINADALARIEPEVRAAGGQIVAITPELEEFTRELKADAHAGFPVLTDIDNGYALSLNLAIWINDEKRRVMTEAGWDIPPYQGNKGWMLPIPATFVVGRDGCVKARFVDPDYRKRMDVEDILRALRAA